MRADIPDLPSFSPGRTPSVINFILGIWILISPFVLGFAGLHGAVWNNVIVGIIITIVAGTGAWVKPNASPEITWINFVLGIWLIVSAFVFGFRMDLAFTWNNIIMGIVAAIVSVVATISRPSAEPPAAP